MNIEPISFCFLQKCDLLHSEMFTEEKTDRINQQLYKQGVYFQFNDVYKKFYT